MLGLLLILSVLIGCDMSASWSDNSDILNNVSVTFTDEDVDDLELPEDPNVTVNQKEDYYQVEIIGGVSGSSGCHRPVSAKSASNRTVTVEVGTKTGDNEICTTAFVSYQYRLSANLSAPFTLNVENWNRTTTVTRQTS